jgi:hypothetical protein
MAANAICETTDSLETLDLETLCDLEIRRDLKTLRAGTPPAPAALILCAAFGFSLVDSPGNKTNTGPRTPVQNRPRQRFRAAAFPARSQIQD